MTERERDILTLVGRGLTHKAAAAVLGISRRSVERTLARARSRCGAESTLQMLVGTHVTLPKPENAR